MSVAAFTTSRATRMGMLALVAAALVSCNGSTGNDRDSGPSKTTLRVEAADADGDALHYSWRVTSGTIDNRDSASTTWTLPDGPGLHFAYVTVSDGRGGHVEQVYAVASDAINTPIAERAPLSYAPPAVSDFDGALMRLRFDSAFATSFANPAGGSAGNRRVYLSDLRVQVVRQGTGEVVFTGITDLAGEVSLPKLPASAAFDVRCSTTENAALATCGSFSVGNEGSTVDATPALPDSQNLRLFGHVALSDGSVCGLQSDFFNLRSAATVELQAADGTTLLRPVRVNRFGDYALDAAVPLRGALKARIACEGYSTTVDVPAPGTAGYVASAPVELSHVIANSRPQVVKMVANGPDGNVRGKMVVAINGAASNSSPGADHFLTFKGKDTALSACMYYRALGAVRGCDAQGGMIDPITLDDWKRARKFAPYTAGNTEVSALYINKMDLGLVRRMTATRTGPNDISFVVCNNPGPEGDSQREIDSTIDTSQAGEKLVACVAMEWSPSPGVNGGRPFTKFLTFAPDGSLLASINLDGRGEKFMPGTCVACHGGLQYNGRFPDRGNPSAFLGSGFLAFDTNNYHFGSQPGLSEAEQSEAIYQLNALVAATEPSGTAPVNRAFAAWYAAGHVQDKSYVPQAWQAADAVTPGAARLYREVIGVSCRTCHAAMGPRFDWDSIVLTPIRAKTHICGGTPDVAVNASMPNALVTRDRIAEKVAADPSIGVLMTNFLGCSSPLPDPIYARR
jgi:hypothetical protein